MSALAKSPALILPGGDRGHPKKLPQLAEQAVSLAVHALSQIHPHQSFLLPSKRVASSAFRAILRPWLDQMVAVIILGIVLCLWRSSRIASQTPSMGASARSGII